VLIDWVSRKRGEISLGPGEGEIIPGLGEGVGIGGDIGVPITDETGRLLQPAIIPNKRDIKTTQPGAFIGTLQIHFTLFRIPKQQFFGFSNLVSLF